MPSVEGGFLPIPACKRVHSRGGVEEWKDEEWRGEKHSRNVRLQLLSAADTDGLSPHCFSPQIGGGGGRRWGGEKEGTGSQHGILSIRTKRGERRKWLPGFGERRGTAGQWRTKGDGWAGMFHTKYTCPTPPHPHTHTQADNKGNVRNESLSSRNQSQGLLSRTTAPSGDKRQLNVWEG